MIKETLFLYKKVFEGSIDPMVIFDAKGNINYGNKAFEEFSSYQLKKLVGKPVSILISGRGRGRVNKILSRTIEKRAKFRDFSTFFLTKNKREIPIALNISPLIDKKDKVIGGLAVFIDIRQLKGLLDALNKAKSELEERVRERTKSLEVKTRELQKAKVELEEARTVLEIRVKARTQELEELNQQLEQKVKERTKELQKKVMELERFQKLTVGRELKMMELKREIEKLKKKST
ncbi:MAG: PAS domain S-box protein [Candidatus Aminicenantia bacterium]